jgi:hypothetical protein
MQLFDILQDGYHTPLTATQISELFQAGRLHRHTRCKPAKQGQWRTIDELFPLLKYHAPWQLAAESPDPNNEFRFRRAVVVGVGLATAAAAALLVYFYVQGQSPTGRRVTSIDYIPSSASQTSASQPLLSTQPIQNTAFPSATGLFSNAHTNEVLVRAENPYPQSYIRSAELARITEQNRREQAHVAQLRRQQEEAVRQQRFLDEQKALGRDEHVPLDQWQVVDVGGEPVRLKVHDNDVTSFDVWINGQWRRQVPKAHGITHSRTDEVPIYRNGRATLYYVWEISGRINDCLLRVRED